MVASPGAGPWTEAHEHELVGLPADEARALVEAAGWVPRVVGLEGAITADYRTNRVDLWVDDGKVVRRATVG